MGLNCQNCNEPLELDMLICPVCDTPVERELKCSSCGKKLKPHWSKCPYCKTATGRGTTGSTPVTPAKNSSENQNYSSGNQNYSRLGGFEETQMGQPQRIQQIEITIGDTVADRYAIKQKIGQGGFGGVYSVHDNLTDKNLAVKVLPFLDKSSIKNILLEFESRDRIKSFDHVIKAYQPQQAQYKGQDLIIYPMELAEKSMRDWLLETKDDLEERLEEGLEIFKQACRGVEAIHEAGLIHLDLKPENILLTENKKAKDITQKCQVKISDFGLARGSGNKDLEMLQDGIGTPAYMAPEQILAARSKDVGKEADIYALGMILYELIDGDLPYSGTPQQIKEKKRDLSLTITIPKSSITISEILEKCLHPNFRNRTNKVDEILNQIELLKSKDESYNQVNSFLKKYGFRDINSYVVVEGVGVISPLIKAILIDDLKMAELLLKSNADGDFINPSGGRTALMYAIERGNMEILKLLNYHTVDTEIKDHSGNTALMIAVSNNNIEIAKLLIEEGGADTYSEESGRLCIIKAIENQNMDMIKLLGFHTDLDIKDDKGTPLLNLALRTNNIEIIKEVIRHNPFVKKTDVNGITPLMIAVENKNIQAAQVLLEYRASVNEIDSDGETALFKACMANEIEIVKLLINAGADVNVGKEDGMNCLEFTSNDEIIKLLIDAGASEDI